MTETLPVFAVHGWALNAGVWAPTSGWAAGREWIAVDLPGHGLRRSEPLGRDPEVVARGLLGRAPPRAVWLGWSLGGLLALAAALLAPERIAALVLVGVPPAFVSRPDWTLGVPRLEFDRMQQAVLRDPHTATAEFLGLAALAPENSAATLRRLRQVLARSGAAAPRALADGLGLLDAIDHRRSLRCISIPALVVAGGGDRLVRPAAAEALAGGLRTARLEFFEGAGHAPFLSHPVRFGRSLDAFLSGVAGE